MKKILAIDASSKAVGWAIYYDKQLKDSGSFLVDNPWSLNWDERAVEIVGMFVKLFKRKIEGHKPDTLVMNLGYVPANGVDTSTLALKMVQDVITFLCVKNGMSYAPVLDSSWIGALSRYVKWEDTENKLNKRATKKKETVRAALNVKYGAFPNTLALEKGEWYKFFMPDGTEGRITDDEGDAIFSGYCFVNKLVSDSTFLTKKEKNKQEKLAELKKEYVSNAKRIETITKKIGKINAERVSFEEKEKANPSKVNKKAIENRIIEVQALGKEIDRLKSENEIIGEKGKQIKKG